jgi:hypothetical protein
MQAESQSTPRLSIRLLDPPDALPALLDAFDAAHTGYSLIRDALASHGLNTSSALVDKQRQLLSPAVAQSARDSVRCRACHSPRALSRLPAYPRARRRPIELYLSMRVPDKPRAHEH